MCTINHDRYFRKRDVVTGGAPNSWSYMQRHLASGSTAKCTRIHCPRYASLAPHRPQQAAKLALRRQTAPCSPAVHSCDSLGGGQRLVLIDRRCLILLAVIKERRICRGQLCGELAQQARRLWPLGEERRRIDIVAPRGGHGRTEPGLQLGGEGSIERIRLAAAAQIAERLCREKRSAYV
eukprot:CAMPEP_0115872482 /NCGR_PEP_ID=MMETSP0287-20121206/23448_1 /TAXON_ID=412157 /ORGANISM="Chrysochromulina rotalis, Strain UIO044" /LENGTH=179 /DNA_ID=CAMNT_0003327403 /DNA_START=19 /DNA_END=559 /DNA_ORIENTATION=+